MLTWIVLLKDLDLCNAHLTMFLRVRKGVFLGLVMRKSG